MNLSFREPDVPCSSFAATSAEAEDLKFEQEAGMLSVVPDVRMELIESEIGPLACSPNLRNICIEPPPVSFPCIIFLS